MSKMDAQRAMREARWAANQKSVAGGAPARPTRPAVRTAAATTGTTKAAGTEASPALAVDAAACGHRSMNGRTCTRPSGHAEKNHRYS